MSRIRGKDTTPELQVRSVVHRFRLHAKDLPGSPSLVLPRLGTVRFVHGCFWNRHRGCRYAMALKFRRAFWQANFEGNMERDWRTAATLRHLSWSVITVWECQLRKPERVAARLGRMLAARA